MVMPEPRFRAPAKETNGRAGCGTGRPMLLSPKVLGETRLWMPPLRARRAIVEERAVRTGWRRMEGRDILQGTLGR